MPAGVRMAVMEAARRTVQALAVPAMAAAERLTAAVATQLGTAAMAEALVVARAVMAQAMEAAEALALRQTTSSLLSRYAKGHLHIL